MKERWFLYFDGACPLCMKSQNKITELLQQNIKITAVDLNGPIAKAKNYSGSVVLETPNAVYIKHYAWLRILENTKYKWFTHILFRPLFIVFYHVISKNRKIISKLIKNE